MPLMDSREPALAVDGELLAGREVLDVPVVVRTDASGETATLELEARQAAAANRKVRLSDLTAADVRRLRDECDELLEALE